MVSSWNTPSVELPMCSVFSSVIEICFPQNSSVCSWISFPASPRPGLPHLCHQPAPPEILCVTLTRTFSPYKRESPFLPGGATSLSPSPPLPPVLWCPTNVLRQIVVIGTDPPLFEAPVSFRSPLLLVRILTFFTIKLFYVHENTEGKEKNVNYSFHLDDYSSSDNAGDESQSLRSLYVLSSASAIRPDFRLSSTLVPQNWSPVQCHRAARMAVDTWSCFNLHFTLFILLCTFVAYCLSFVFPTSPKFCHVLNDLVPRCPYCTFMLHFDVTGQTLYGILEDSAFTECCSKVDQLYNFRKILM